MNFIRELTALKEEATKRYLAMFDAGDGLNFKVKSTPQEAYDYIVDFIDEGYSEIVEFTGELLSLELSGHGESIVNDDEGTKTIFQGSGGVVNTDELKLHGE